MTNDTDATSMTDAATTWCQLGALLGLDDLIAAGDFLITGREPVGGRHRTATVEHLNTMIIGALIIAFLIIEPHGLARFWELLREKLIMWPFPH